MFLFLNSCIAPRGEIITNLSILHVVLFLFGVLRYESLRDAAVGDVALASPCCTSGQRSRVVSYRHSWDAQCFLSTVTCAHAAMRSQLDHRGTAGSVHSTWASAAETPAVPAPRDRLWVVQCPGRMDIDV